MDASFARKKKAGLSVMKWRMVDRNAMKHGREKQMDKFGKSSLRSDSSLQNDGASVRRERKRGVRVVGRRGWMYCVEYYTIASFGNGQR